MCGSAYYDRDTLRGHNDVSVLGDASLPTSTKLAGEREVVAPGMEGRGDVSFRRERMAGGL